MSAKKKRSKKGRSYIIFIIIALVLIFKFIPRGRDKTIRPQVAPYMDSFKTSGVIIKNEKIYYASNKGNLESFTKEGSRASSGSKVAILTSLDGAKAIEDELGQINKSIKELKDIRIDVDSLEEGSREEYIENIKSKIQENIKQGRLENIYIMREQLNVLLTGENNVEADNTLSQLEKRQNELFKALNENVKDYYIDSAGMISYKLDGYEEKYKIEDFEKHSYEKVKRDIEAGVSEIKKAGPIVDANEPIFKNIDNFSWNLAVKIDDLKSIDNLKDRKTLKIRINDSNDELEGKIIGVNKFKNKAVVVLEFRSKLQDYYLERFPIVEVIKYNTYGFKIPKTAIIENENVKGVMVKDISNIARFRPVIIISEDKDNYYLKTGDDNGYLLTNDNETIRTINTFDEVFVNPKGIKVGKILD